MSQENRITGKDLYVSYNGTEISGDQTSFGWDEKGESADLTAADDTSHYRIPTMVDCNFTMDTYFGGTELTAYNACAPNSYGTLLVGPWGTASGYPKFTWSRILCSDRSPAIPYNAGMTFSVKWDGSSKGTVTTW